MATKSPKKKSAPVDVSQKISLDTNELRLIREVLLNYNTSVENAPRFLQIIRKINQTILEAQK